MRSCSLIFQLVRLQIRLNTYSGCHFHLVLSNPLKWKMVLDRLSRSGKVQDPDNNGLMNPSVLVETLERYNRFCEQGQEADFGMPEIWMEPLESPPFFYVKLWPA